MTFGEKLRERRKKRGLTINEVATAIGVTKWTFSNYERGNSYPKNRDNYRKLADFFDVDVNYFYTENDEFLMEAAEHYGKRGRAQAESLLAQASAMFAGGELSPEDQMAFLGEMQRLWLDSKQRAKEKYTPSKYKIWPDQQEIE